jgi:hypothetical protein
MIFEKVLFTPEECQYILSFADKFEPYKHYKQPECIVYLLDHPELREFLSIRNEEYGLREFPWYIKLLRYDVGVGFNLHRDTLGADGRIKTIVVQLSDSNSYSGGDLQIEDSSNFFKASRQIGSSVMFSSQKLHEVTPITEGVRYVMVTWLEEYNIHWNKSLV